MKARQVLASEQVIIMVYLGIELAAGLFAIAVWLHV
jgi:hypothetical protein